jgi:hypothetical protein
MSGFPQSGGCQCGKIRYTLHAAPIVVYCCHCTQCQKQSSSAFGISVRVNSADLSIVGTPSAFVQTVGDKQAAREFCPDCGTRLFHKRPQYDGHLNIKGGTFDDAQWLNPAGHIWTASKLPWVILPADAIRYDHQPEDYETLAAAWKPNF